jgi:hypothetical protein
VPNGISTSTTASPRPSQQKREQEECTTASRPSLASGASANNPSTTVPPSLHPSQQQPEQGECTPATRPLSASDAIAHSTSHSIYSRECVPAICLPTARGARSNSTSTTALTWLRPAQQQPRHRRCAHRSSNHSLESAPQQLASQRQKMPVPTALAPPHRRRCTQRNSNKSSRERGPTPRPPFERGAPAKGTSTTAPPSPRPSQQRQQPG